MRRPKDVGTAVDAHRYRDWIQDYSGYRLPVTEGRIDRWREQFEDVDSDLSARLLDCVDYISQQRIGAAFKDLLTSLPGWDINEQRRDGKWRFVPFSASTGESGDSMLSRFRHANNMGGRQYNNLFIHSSQLLLQEINADDTVVFVDDFSGTGQQACSVWENALSELLPTRPNVYLVLVCARQPAIDRIHNDTDLIVSTHHVILTSHDIFSDECHHFSEQEKERIKHYCERADPNRPLGFGECGLVVVFQHSSPNNSIPILHVQNCRWIGLFSRYD